MDLILFKPVPLISGGNTKLQWANLKINDEHVEVELYFEFEKRRGSLLFQFI